MTRYERLKAKMRELEEKRASFIRSGELFKVARIDNRIKEQQALIDEAAQYEPMNLKKALDDEGVPYDDFLVKIIELHLAADYLNDCSVVLKEQLKKYDLTWCSLFPLVDEITALSGSLAGQITEDKFKVTRDLLLDDERLIDDLHLLTRRYMYNKINNK